MSTIDLEAFCFGTDRRNDRHCPGCKSPSMPYSADMRRTLVERWRRMVQAKDTTKLEYRLALGFACAVIASLGIVDAEDLEREAALRVAQAAGTDLAYERADRELREQMPGLDGRRRIGFLGTGER